MPFHYVIRVNVALECRSIMLSSYVVCRSLHHCSNQTSSSCITFERLQDFKFHYSDPKLKQLETNTIYACSVGISNNNTITLSTLLCKTRNITCHLYSSLYYSYSSLVVHELLKKVLSTIDSWTPPGIYSENP